MKFLGPGGTGPPGPPRFPQPCSLPLITFTYTAAALVDIVRRSMRNRDTFLTTRDIKTWQRKHGQFKYPTILLVRTGNAKYWADRARYFGIDNNTVIDGGSTGQLQTPILHFPGESGMEFIRW